MPFDRQKIYKEADLLARLFKISLVSIVLYLIFRLIFTFMFFKAATVFEVIYANYIGFKFDLRLSALQLVPVFFLYIFTRGKIKILNLITAIIMSISQILFVIFYCIDLGNYEYITQRISSAFFLDDLVEYETSLEMAKDTYPLVPVIIVLFVLIYLLSRFYYKNISSLKKINAHVKEIFVCGLIILIASWGRIGIRTLTTTDAYFSHNRYLSQLALNPVINIFSSRKEEMDILKEYKLDQAKTRLKDFFIEDSTDDLTRIIGKDGKKYNVIIVLLESLAANKTGLFNNKLDPTPYFDKLANESLLFTNFFTPAYKTNRGIWTLLTGLPDVRSSVPRSRDLDNLKQLTYFDHFVGFDKSYFIGGHANWGNLDSFYKISIPDMKLQQLGDFKLDPVDAWGIADYDLFNLIISDLESKDGPFISVIQTSGFHRPYTIPDHVGYKVVDNISDDEIRDYGFNSLKEYNSLRLQDYSFGHFIKEFKKSKHYENTIIIAVGDHGLNSVKSINVPKGFHQHRLALHHTPLVIHFPAKGITGVNSEVIGNQMDIFPTAAKLAGVEMRTKALGRDLLSDRAAEQNFGFIFSWDFRPSLVGLIDREHYLEILDDRPGLFDYRGEFPLRNIANQHESKTKSMTELAKAIYKYSLLSSKGEL